MSKLVDRIDESPTSSLPATHTPQHRVNILGLFAGIGGIEIGLGNAGHKTCGFYEIDPAAKAVLENRFPGIETSDDVRTLTEIDPRVDLVTAGFPCVNLSQAGRMEGLDGAGSGLVRHVLSVVATSQLKNLLLENVPFMLRLGRGSAMAEIVGALEQAGFKWAYRVIDARSFGIPQRRPRVLLFASRERDPRSVLFPPTIVTNAVHHKETLPVVGIHSIGFYSTEGNTGSGLVANSIPPIKPGSKLGIASPPAVLMPNRTVGTPSIQDAERLQGFEPGWTESAQSIGRNARWRLVGNAVNVKVSEWVGSNLGHVGEFEAPDMRVHELSEVGWTTAAWNVGSGRAGMKLSPVLEIKPIIPLHEFLLDELRPLSYRATAGFVMRAERSSLRFPAGFIDALRTHLLVAPR
jgi:DNA (cytosine-5)-methyltransferase 1